MIVLVDKGLDNLIDLLRRNRGDLKLQASDFRGWSKGARFYPLLYMMTRVWKAKDWNTGLELSSHLLGKLSKLQVHHIFPKALLYKHNYTMSEVNAIANFTFLTQETNLIVSDRDPSEYFEEFLQKQPGSVESHWIPMDKNLWKAENYLDFLEARRELLAKASNEFLDSLYQGSIPEKTEEEHIAAVSTEASIPGGIASEEEEELLLECNEWIIDQGLPEGEFLHELVGVDTSAPLAVLDLAWPDGLQQGLSAPVALLINEGKETEEAANIAGYRFFTNIDSFKEYVNREILALA